MTKKIFEKSREDVLIKQPNIQQSFESFAALEWVDSFTAKVDPSPEDYENESISSLLENFLGNKKLLQCDSIGLWQTFVQKSAIEHHPFLSFSFLLAGDVLFQKIHKLEDFYVLDARLKGKTIPYRNFMERLIALNPDVVKLFSTLRDFLPCTDQQVSPVLKKMSEELRQAIPVSAPVEAVVAVASVSAPSTPSQENAKTQIQNVAPLVEKSHSQEKDSVASRLQTLHSHPIFGSFIPHASLIALCEAVAENRKEEIPRLLSEMSSFTSWRDRFTKNLALLNWALQSNKEKETLWSAKTLWETVYFLGARDKKDINLDAPQDMILALWEPNLYCALVHLTVKAFEAFGDKFTFTVGSQNTKQLIEKVKSHPFMLGVFIQ